MRYLYQSISRWFLFSPIDYYNSSIQCCLTLWNILAKIHIKILHKRQISFWPMRWNIRPMTFRRVFRYQIAISVSKLKILEHNQWNPLILHRDWIMNLLQADACIVNPSVICKSISCVGCAVVAATEEAWRNDSILWIKFCDNYWTLFKLGKFCFAEVIFISFMFTAPFEKLISFF